VNRTAWPPRIGRRGDRAEGSGERIPRGQTVRVLLTRSPTPGVQAHSTLPTTASVRSDSRAPKEFYEPGVEWTTTPGILRGTALR